MLHLGAVQQVAAQPLGGVDVAQRVLAQGAQRVGQAVAMLFLLERLPQGLQAAQQPQGLAWVQGRAWLQTVLDMVGSLGGDFLSW